MSQQQSLTNFEKGKLLALTRDRIGLGREEMARRLNLDRLYLAQLEEGRRAVDDWYLDRAAEVAREFERRHH